MSDFFHFFAFISFSSADVRWGKRVQRRLEGYRMPATLCNEHGWSRKPLKPVFFAPTDIQPGDLSEELKTRLRSSKNLIVIASPRSAQSEWVAKEITFFHSLPQGNNIFFFIIDGHPMSGNPQTECFNQVIRQLGMGEPLGVNIHERMYRFPWKNKERAYIQLITKLLGIEFDDLWQRHRRRQRQHGLLLCFGIMMLTFLTSHMVRANGDTNIELMLKESTVHNQFLEPRSNAVVRMWIGGEERRDTLKNETDKIVLFSQVPRRMLGEKVRVCFECYDFYSIDTQMTLREQMTLPFCRDTDLFGRVEFTLIDRYGRPLPSQNVTVGKVSVYSDSEGFVRVFIPAAEQRQCYDIVTDIPLQDTLLVMPCVGSGVVIKAL